ncbi:hypothetical protein N0V93_005977 [Gnomoniopsis smithogilvyi]|uniref:Alpha/beta hydrolase fold-3 domain-containing protein n=1 Tax=Gnomoniopsis smithogilvyi TaxID=1191159 RepID=A0A9W8YTT0_9PEZI|nr:hypothetical protein N0V93_005977 [Gnomoniopsis smithogilvyi]
MFLRVYTMWIAIKPLQRDKHLAESEYFMRRRRLLIPSRDPGRCIKADMYLPPETSFKDSAGPRPVLLNYHGSGFVLTGLLGSNILYCARVAFELGIIVIDADYRKAPEHPFPAASNDVEDVLRWISSSAAEEADWLLDKTRVAISGFSSGGSLALAAASVVRTDAHPALGVDIRAVVGIYPSTDLVTPPEKKRPPKEGIGKTSPGFLRICLDCYVPDQEQRADPRASPGRADPNTFPQSVAIFTKRDTMRRKSDDE